MTDDEIREQLRERPDPIDPKRWAEMDPQTRLRFHEFGNHIMRLEGIITGLAMRLPADPHAIPLLQQRVDTMESTQEEIREDVKGIRKDLNSLALKVAAATAVLTFVGNIVFQLLSSHS